MKRRHGLIAVAVLLSFGLGACSDETASGTTDASEDSAPSASGAVEVIAEDIKFPSDSFDAEAGTVSITYTNEGSIEHTLLIDGVDDFKLDVPANGDVDEGEVELEAGTYTLYCDISGHREAGMEATLEVG